MLIRLGICTFRIMSVSHVCVIASKLGVLQLFVCHFRAFTLQKC